MGGKSRKTGAISRKLIDRLKNGKPITDGKPKKKKAEKSQTHDPFNLNP